MGKWRGPGYGKNGVDKPTYSKYTDNGSEYPIGFYLHTRSHTAACNDRLS